MTVRANGRTSLFAIRLRMLLEKMLTCESNARTRIIDGFQTLVRSDDEIAPPNRAANATRRFE